ncbi:UDP-N-acetylglucosamine 1-carboxyvinyltransferase [Cohnella zeiphila]|uniref:UDP-N-acetylglucosamine 1-carboxyvinyltransferase n=1 Tax=Cohnella zeiphila TaxID=2761120 RepID=A0A7X0SI65_9BACL|nr:UDP-N-acetylglucosamine 1-carboxyvinyltransferase [Cohnella zeiphila]
MKWIRVEQTTRLEGSVQIPGSKNSSLALLAAACLADGPVALHGIPRLADFQAVFRLAEEIGCRMYRDDSGIVHVDSSGIRDTDLDPVHSSSFRTAYYFIGALLAKYGVVSLGYPGGDDFVSRPIDQHIKALQLLGARFTFYPNRYVVEAKELTGATVYFDTISSGATINAMLAAARAKGTTVLLNAACDPEVTDTAILLNRMGARITGAGTSTVRIRGVERLTGCVHTVIPDRLIAGAFLMAPGLTGGSVTVENVIPDHMRACISKLSEMGLDVEIGDQRVTSRSDGAIKATRVRTAMYPGFPTDLQQPLTALLTQARGRSIVSEKIYPNRFGHVPQLLRMGADIKVRSGVAVVKGKAALQGAHVRASDIRAGISLLLAGLAAEGSTTISGVHHLERGYENVVESFRSLGANVSWMESGREEFVHEEAR